MSDTEHTPGGRPPLKFSLFKRLPHIPEPVGEWGIFAAWIAGLLLITVLGWSLTGNVRRFLLLRQVNRVLVLRESGLRLVEPLAVRGRGSSRFGVWFSVLTVYGRAGNDDFSGAGSGNTRRGVVFPLMSGVRSMTMLAIVDGVGRVESLFPISANAQFQFESLPPGTVNLYVQRIEENFGRIRWERKK